MDKVLKNGSMEILIKEHGAEMRKLAKNGVDYLWNADPAFWNRSSPVLFPFVGAVKDKEYRHEGKTFTIGQHGFARDKDFELISETENTVWYGLTEDEASLAIYPFRFRLEIGYELEESAVKVMWKVKNTDEKTMYFSIGAHPAFFCPVHPGEKQTDCAFRFYDMQGRAMEDFTYTVFGQGGCVSLNTDHKVLSDGVLPITEHLFDGDALVIENSQVGKISILGKEGDPFLSVEFTSPLVGVWSPPKKQAPFVCIEPWYGRCDAEDFAGELKERLWEKSLKNGEEFYAEYRILVED